MCDACDFVVPVELCEMDREERIKDALQLVCLLLPPANRRKLHLLLKLMGRMSDNPQIELDVNQTTRTLVSLTHRSVFYCYMIPVKHELKWL